MMYCKKVSCQETSQRGKQQAMRKREAGEKMCSDQTWTMGRRGWGGMRDGVARLSLSSCLLPSSSKAMWEMQGGESGC